MSSNSSFIGLLFQCVQQIFCPQNKVQNEEDRLQQTRPQTHETYPPQEPPKPYIDHSRPHQHGSTPPAHKPAQAPARQSAKKGHREYINENLINQDNEHYKQLRTRAREAGDAMAKCFDESHRAYEAHDGARAKELSNEGHRHQAEMNRLNEEASAWIYHANNTDSGPNEIDLHGLYVKEAITYTERAIQEAQSRGETELHLIVGKGVHSTDHVAKLKPAIEEVMQKYNIAAHVDEHNSGVLIIVLDGRRNDQSLGSDDITRRLEKKDDECVIA